MGDVSMDLTPQQRLGAFLGCFTLGVTLMWLGSPEPPRAAQAADKPIEQQIQINVAAELPAPERRPQRRTTAPLSMQRPNISAPALTSIEPSDSPAVTEENFEATLRRPRPDKSSESQEAAERSKPITLAATTEPLPILARHIPPRKPEIKQEKVIAQVQPEDPIADGSWDTSSPGPAPVRPEPTIDAGEDQVIWAGTNEVHFEALSKDGSAASFSWDQSRGPDVFLIPDLSGQITVTGFVDQRPSWKDTVYSFEVTAIDADERKQSDVVKVWVKWAPEMEVSAAPEDKPKIRRRFQELDGLPIAHYNCTLRPSDYPARFAIVADGPLSFTPSGAAHDFVYSVVGDRHLYEVSVYQNGEESLSELVIYVQSSDQIPAVVKAVVEWN